MGIGAGKMPAFTFRQMVARDQPVASITAGKRRNFLVVLMNAPWVLELQMERRGCADCVSSPWRIDEGRSSSRVKA
jgi:hypothetical protein